LKKTWFIWKYNVTAFIITLAAIKSSNLGPMLKKKDP
jgi:hypothetical protein